MAKVTIISNILFRFVTKRTSIAYIAKISNKNYNMELESTYLVQRLQEPYPGHENNPFNFGCGYKNGGLSDEAMNLFKRFFSFDYMGAAEYEFGAIPKCLQAIAKNVQNYCAIEVVINKTPVYALCHKELSDQVIIRLKELSKGKIYTKGYCGLDQAVGLNLFTSKEKCRYIGWLELDNGFFFFTSKQAFDGVRQIFGINS